MIPYLLNGKLADLDNLETLSVWDTPKHLVGICRFAGVGFNVLDHSLVLCSLFPGEPMAQAWSLTHDCHEAITGDIPGPFLKLLKQTSPEGYASLIGLVHQIDARFQAELGITVPQGVRDRVLEADIMLRSVEARWFAWPGFPGSSRRITRALSAHTKLLVRSEDDKIDLWAIALRRAMADCKA